MPAMSMTGFARWDEEQPDGSVLVWELRSVNGKSLDLRLRLPAGFDALEPVLRKRAGERLMRGNVQAVLQRNNGEATASLGVNRAALAELVALADELVAGGHAQLPRADGLLALRGVLENRDPHAEVTSAMRDAADAGFTAAVDALVAARAEEGEAIGSVLDTRLDKIAALAEAAEADPARTPAAITARLNAQFAQILDAPPALDPARLAQEVAILATRADICEELDRLRAHVKAARLLLAGSGAVGRRLDFLAQEFNRESNTICSKSSAASLTAIGLDLKVAVDQFREQVQNIE